MTTYKISSIGIIIARLHSPLIGCSRAIFQARWTDEDVEDTSFRLAAGGGSEVRVQDKRVGTNENIINRSHLLPSLLFARSKATNIEEKSSSTYKT